MPDPQDDDLDRSPLAVATRYSDGLAALPRLPPLPGEGEIRGTGPGESRDPFAVANGTFEDQQAQALSPTMGAYGAGQAAGDTINSLRNRDWSGALASGLPLVAMAFAPGAPKGGGIRAFHGSPHDFNQFDASKIGTGEGAQAYGHGLYFAGNEGVARSYRDALERPSKSLEPSKLDDLSLSPFANYPPDAVSMAKDLLAKHDNNPILAAKTASDMFLKGDDTARMANNLIAAYSKHFTDVNKGKMYEVNINADPSSFLDWDKPLSQQSEAATKAIDPLVRRYYGEPLDPADYNAGNLYQELYNDTGTKGGATESLRKAGIPGIRYLDQGSRGAAAKAADLTVEKSPSGLWWAGPKDGGGGGDYFATEADARAAHAKMLADQQSQLSHNYVIFPGNEHLISIVNKRAMGGGVPPYPGDDPDFLSMLANNPRGWGNAPPRPVWERNPMDYQGEISNSADRPSDPFATPIAESISPTMGAYGAGQAAGCRKEVCKRWNSAVSG